jgi:hypothetical protein
MRNQIVNKHFAALSISALASIGPTLAAQSSQLATDWLIDPAPFKATFHENQATHELTLDNGTIRRVWRIEPNAACVALDNLMTGASILRGVKPEAQLVINGRPFDIGGLLGQPNYAFLTPAWLDNMTASPDAFQYIGYEVGEPVERFAWKRVRHHAPGAAWPPAGVSLRMDYAPPTAANLAGVIVSVHYEMYDGIPCMSKWVTVHNDSDQPVEIDRFTSEILAVVEFENDVETRDGVAPQRPRTLHVETDYAFGGFKHANANRQSVHWVPDPQFKTQVNYRRLQPCLLRVEPMRGPDQIIAPGDTFESFRTFELVHDSTDRERRGLALRRMYRTVAPWVTENPLILHVVSTNPEVVKAAIDQAAECGFEMVSLSFGSGLSMENEQDANITKFKALADYAMSKGIHLGGYSLLASRSVGNGNDVVSPPGEKPTFGNCPALTSEWGQAYFRKLTRFFDETGFLQFTHDGSYPGDFDITARPPLQRGLDDSQWAQWKIITGFYQYLRGKGAYLRIPDYYYLAGGNECGMGYRETNWSLPRAQQVIHTRQNIYDGTWEKTPSMGWMFVPLTQYHGGGAAATIEPLDEHIDHYQRMMLSNLAMGVQAVYRGHRLYDTPRVRDMVIGTVAWFKEYRDILESDVVHGRRADGRDLDWMLHVNPALAEKGMLVVFNPLEQDVRRTIRVSLYYTGITDFAAISANGDAPAEYHLNRDYTVDLTVTVPAGGMSWYAICER